MSRKEFIDQLERLLRDIPKSDRDEALEYYESYFDDAGAENEASVIQELGSPGRIAAEVKASLQDDRLSGEYTDRGYEDSRFKEGHTIRKRPVQNRRGGRSAGSTLLIILIAVLTFPVWGAVLGALFSVVVGVFGVLFGLVVGSLAGSMGLLIGGIALAVVAIPYMATSMGLGIAMLGAAMMCLAVGMLLLIAFGWFTFKAVPSVVRALIDLGQRILHRVRGGERE